VGDVDQLPSVGPPGQGSPDLINSGRPCRWPRLTEVFRQAPSRPHHHHRPRINAGTIPDLRHRG